ncbi:PDZ domain-containing protein [Evansella cellulosilytica]|uniref:PDZ domain-containing protein n=1 Tax=Evansella cellulosilytica (strain ATCC 21833 / DSM 2522 / FERM P-1141 / JCM 9156 / N-4) TaxID=649639 RepID=E6TRJ1_EVAC2|nr:PDZ domain-containing protein [Evansella cellulosilytica]ADU31821.1 hypothetical protein Bcell_3580 [Evansella cellulosilytica DSM 2522]
MDVIGIELLKAFGRMWLHPLPYLFVLLALWFGYSRVKRERKNFHTRIYDVVHELFFPIAIGLSFGLILSIIFPIVGLEIPIGMMVLLLSLWIIVLPFRSFKYLSMTFVASIALLISFFLPEGGTGISLLNDWLSEIKAMDMVGFAWFIAVLFLAESLLIFVHGWKKTYARLTLSKRGKTIGNHEAKRLWPVPILFLFPVGNLAFEGWWPLFDSISTTGQGLMFLPFILGFQMSVQSSYSKDAVKHVGKRLILLSILLLALAGVATFIPLFVYAVAIVGILGREIIYIMHHTRDKHRTGLFTSREKGLTVLGVLPHSTAEKMGIEVGEVILKVNGWEVYSQRDLYEALQENSAFCKIQVVDRSGELRFAQSSLYEGDHHHIGLLFIPDGEMVNLSRRALRSSVVIHHDRNGGKNLKQQVNDDEDIFEYDTSASEEASASTIQAHPDVLEENSQEDVIEKSAVQAYEDAEQDEATVTNDLEREGHEMENNVDVESDIEDTTVTIEEDHDYAGEAAATSDEIIEESNTIEDPNDRNEATQAIEGSAEEDAHNSEETTEEDEQEVKSNDEEKLNKEDNDVLPYGQAAGLSAFYEEFRTASKEKKKWGKNFKK